MNGWQLIRDGYDHGLAPSAIYRPVTRLYNRLRPFVDADYYGVLACDDREEDEGLDERGARFYPAHANADANPFPVLDARGRRARRTWSRRDLMLHAASEPSDRVPRFLFMVNGTSSDTHLICHDVDGTDPDATGRLAAELYLEHYPEHRVYTEASRNRRGCYVWTLVRRESSPALFNALCNRLSSALRGRYRDGERAWFDGIKATVHYDERSKFDRLVAELDGRPNDQHRGLLATMPCAGFLARGSDGLRQLGAFLEFVDRSKGRYRHAVPESHLRSILASLDPVGLAGWERERENVLTGGSAAAADAAPSAGPTFCLPSSCRASCASSSSSTNASPSECVRRTTEGEGRERWDRLLDRARSATNPLARMRYASCLHYYQHGRHARDVPELVRYYESLGLHTGQDVDGRRVQRAHEALAKHRHGRDGGGGGRGGGRYLPEEWLPLVRRHVTGACRMHPAVGYRYRIEDELLAAACALLTRNAFAANRADRMHTTSQQGLLAWYRVLHERGTITCGYADNNKRSAVLKLLQLAGLMVLRDGECRYGGAAHGIGRKYAPGPNHPRFEEFVALYGHRVDHRSLAPLVMPETVAAAVA